MVNGLSRAERSAARREEIISAAARLFRQRGFIAVSVDDIGAAVGVSGPAMYRHFSGKQELLAEVVLSYLGRIEEAQTAGSRVDPRGAVLTVSVEHPDALAVLLRQLRHLDGENMTRVRQSYRRIAQHTCPGSLIDGGGDEAHLRKRAAAGALVTAALVKALASSARLRLVDDMVSTILAEPIPEPPAAEPVVAAPTSGNGSLVPVSRREAILASATKLFRQNSYDGVSLRDIGNEVGVTASAIRRHFDTKEELLAALFNRGGEQVAASIVRVLQESSTPGEAIQGMIASYARLALQQRDLVFVYVTETHSLPMTQREERRLRQRAHVNEMAHLQRQLVPTMSREECRTRAASAFSLINEVVMNDELVRRPGLQDELTALAMSVMRVTRVPAGKRG